MYLLLLLLANLWLTLSGQSVVIFLARYHAGTHPFVHITIFPNPGIYCKFIPDLFLLSVKTFTKSFLTIF